MVAAIGTSPPLLLGLLACPVGMGLMILFMGRGLGMGGRREKQEPDGSSLAEMKAVQARLAVKIEELQRSSSGAEPRSRDGARPEQRVRQVR